MMDITDSSDTRTSAGIDLFLEGGGVVYHGVTFSRSSQGGGERVVVSSFSDYEPDRATQDMARQKIRRSELVGDDLAEKQARFREIWDSAERIFHFCWDYGMGAICIATERDGTLEWKLDKA